MAGKIKKRWKKISSEIDFERTHLKLIKEKFILPNGETKDFHKLKKDDFVVIIPKDKEFIYLINSFRWAIKKESLELSAGFIEKGESLLAAAKRELKEETGITAKKFTYLGWYYVWIGMSDIKGHAFLAEDLFFDKQNLESEEYGMTVKKIKLSELNDFVRKGRIKNGTTLNSLYLYLLRKKD
ncbi:MAG: NUDIX hydrolase [Patescibacteria group bacterium]